MDMYNTCMCYITARQLQVEVIDYGYKENLNQYLLENLEGSSRLIKSMINELQTANTVRLPQLMIELDSAVLGWVETWNALH
jgi:hypothetical protein